MAVDTRTYTFAFDPDPEGGFVVTCPALPGLVTHGTDLAEARVMALDAMDGYIEALLEDGDPLPDSDPSHAGPRFDELARVLRPGVERSKPLFEQLTSKVSETA